MFAFDVQGRRLDGHSGRGKLLLHRLREDMHNGISLQTAGAAGARNVFAVFPEWSEKGGKLQWSSQFHAAKKSMNVAAGQEMHRLACIYI